MEFSLRKIRAGSALSRLPLSIEAVWKHVKKRTGSDRFRNDGSIFAERLGEDIESG